MQAINWNEVDEYPSVEACSNLSNKEERQQCFFDYLTALIQQKLSIDTLVLQYPELDTVKVKVTVAADSTVSFEPVVTTHSPSANEAIIDSILVQRLTDFPKIVPALKRGIPVRTQFELPVIVEVQP